MIESYDTDAILTLPRLEIPRLISQECCSASVRYCNGNGSYRYQGLGRNRRVVTLCLGLVAGHSLLFCIMRYHEDILCSLGN